MAGGLSAFNKGGCGCLVLFAVICLLLAGQACGYVDNFSLYLLLFGAVPIFLVGGIIALILRGIYNQGRRDGRYDHDDEAP